MSKCLGGCIEAHEIDLNRPGGYRLKWHVNANADCLSFTPGAPLPLLFWAEALGSLLLRCREPYISPSSARCFVCHLVQCGDLVLETRSAEVLNGMTVKPCSHTLILQLPSHQVRANLLGNCQPYGKVSGQTNVFIHCLVFTSDISLVLLGVFLLICPR